MLLTDVVQPAVLDPQSEPAPWVDPEVIAK